jgi:hypothetical protein
LLPKLLADEQKQQHVDICSELVAAIHRYSCAMLDIVATKDELWSAPGLLTQKNQSQQSIKQRQPGPVKARLHASWTKWMLLAYFHSKGHHQRRLHHLSPGQFQEAAEVKEVCAGRRTGAVFPVG